MPGLLLVPLSTVLPPRRMLVICLLIGTLAFPLDRMRLQLRDGDPYLLDEIRFVLETTPSDAKVLTGWRGSGVFRRHAYFYFFLHPEIRKMLTRKQRGEDVVRALVAEEPELVVYDRAVRALRPEVTEYIRRHYRPTGVGPLLRRIDQSP